MDKTEREADKQEVEGKVFSWKERLKYLQGSDISPSPLYDTRSKPKSVSLLSGLETRGSQKNWKNQKELLDYMN